MGGSGRCGGKKTKGNRDGAGRPKKKKKKNAGAVQSSRKKKKKKKKEDQGKSIIPLGDKTTERGKT